MERLAARDLRQLLAKEGEASAPHVSIYVPLGVTEEERASARDRLARLVSRAEILLLRHYPQMTSAFVKPLKALAERLAKISPARGLAVFCSPRRVAYVPLEQRVGEMAVVADSFHLKPLLPMAQAQEAFFVLELEAGLARLFEGTSEGLSERQVFRASSGVDGANVLAYRPRSSARRDGARRLLGEPQGARDIAAFLGDVDRRLKRLVGRRRIPVILAGSSELVGLYRSLSRLGALASKHIRMDRAGGQVASRLHEVAWPIANEMIVGQRRRLTRGYKTAQLRGEVVERLEDVARAACAGKIETLFLEANVCVWGRLDPEGGIEFAKGQDDGPADDLLDDLAEKVLAKGGKVHLLRRSEMPTRAAAVAVLR